MIKRYSDNLVRISSLDIRLSQAIVISFAQAVCHAYICVLVRELGLQFYHLSSQCTHNHSVEIKLLHRQTVHVTNGHYGQMSRLVHGRAFPSFLAFRIHLLIPYLTYTPFHLSSSYTCSAFISSFTFTWQNLYCALYFSSSDERPYFLSTHLPHISIQPFTTVMSTFDADVDAAAPRGRRSRRRNRRNGGSNISAGTEKSASNDDGIKSGFVVANASSQNTKNKTNCQFFSFP